MTPRSSEAKVTRHVKPGDRVRIVGSIWWPGVIAPVADVGRDAWGLVTRIGVDVGRDDGPVFFRPEDLEVVP